LKIKKPIHSKIYFSQSLEKLRQLKSDLSLPLQTIQLVDLSEHPAEEPAVKLRPRKPKPASGED
jgi:hypothetical protein